LDRHMNLWVYMHHGVVFCHPRGAEPPGHPQPAGILGAIRRRDRAPAADASNLGVQAPPGAARGRLRSVARRSPAARLSDPARAVHGGRRLAGAVPALLDGPRRCARTPSQSDGEEIQERKEPMSNREQYMPGPASGAEVRKDGEKWTLVLVRALRHPPAMVWQGFAGPAQTRER